MDLNLKQDHVFGGFRWEIEPKCKCGRLLEAVKDKFVFVSNFTEEGQNHFYIMPLDADGDLAKSSGIPIQYCPWCGDKITGRKKY